MFILSWSILKIFLILLVKNHEKPVFKQGGAHEIKVRKQDDRSMRAFWNGASIHDKEQSVCTPSPTDFEQQSRQSEENLSERCNHAYKAAISVHINTNRSSENWNSGVVSCLTLTISMPFTDRHVTESSLLVSEWDGLEWFLKFEDFSGRILIKVCGDCAYISL